MIQIHVKVADVDARLAELGLAQEALSKVIRQGYVAFAACTANDPPLYPGFSAWAAMVRGLREYLLPEWSRSDESNYSLVVNPTGTVAIAVATGDEATGRQESLPTTKSSKGPSTVEAVTTNQLQLKLPFIFPPLEAPVDSVNSSAKRMTWILLVHRGLNEVRCELSLPTSMGSDGRVDGWRERIILSAIPTDPEVLEIVPPQQPQPDIVVDIKRRA